MTAKLADKAHEYFQLFPQWANNGATHGTWPKAQLFDFSVMKPMSKADMQRDGPAVLFATPGMLTGGASLDVRFCRMPKHLSVDAG